MSKILDLIKTLYEDLESDWKLELKRINLWTNVYDLYAEFPENNRKANTILAFIAFAYDKDSDWIEMDMDRTKNKEKILTTLAGLNWRTDVNYVSALNGTLDPYNALIEWYLDNQTDKTYVEMITGFEFHSRAQTMANAKYHSPKEMADAGKLLGIAKERLADAEDIRMNLFKENVKIDTVLKKENRKSQSERGSSNFDYMSHEAWLFEEERKKKAAKAGDKDPGYDRFDDDQEYEEDDFD